VHGVVAGLRERFVGVRWRAICIYYPCCVGYREVTILNYVSQFDLEAVDKSTTKLARVRPWHILLIRASMSLLALQPNNVLVFAFSVCPASSFLLH
jgi:hypothetical protein